MVLSPCPMVPPQRSQLPTVQQIAVLLQTLLQPLFYKPRLSPQPLVHRNRKSVLGSIRERLGQATRSSRAQDLLQGTAVDVHVRWYTQGEIDNLSVEEG